MSLPSAAAYASAAAPAALHVLLSVLLPLLLLPVPLLLLLQLLQPLPLPPPLQPPGKPTANSASSDRASKGDVQEKWEEWQEVVQQWIEDEEAADNRIVELFNSGDAPTQPEGRPKARPRMP